MKKIYISVCLAMSLSLAMNAKDDLNKEITIEKDAVPVELKATKSNTLPQVVKTTVPKKTLTYTEWSKGIDVPLTIPTLDPYGYQTSHNFSNKRGYLDFGAGSNLNIVGSAGYHIVDTEKSSFKMWLQHTSTWAGKNSSKVIVGDKFKQKFNDNVIGADFEHNFWEGKLSLNAFYHFDKFNYYGGVKTDVQDFNQTVNEFNIRAGWKNNFVEGDKLRYSVSLAYNRFGFSKNAMEFDGGIKENRFRLNLNGEYAVTDNVSAGAFVNGNYAYYTGLQNDLTSNATYNKEYGVIGLTPYIRYSQPNVDVQIGANIDFSIKNGSPIKVSPNVKANVNLIDGLALYANVGGGKNINFLSDYSNECRYLNPSQLLGTTVSPLDAEIGFNIGQFYGFYLKPFFGYGIFKGKLTPYLIERDAQHEIIPAKVVTLKEMGLKGWRAGVEFGYQYKSIVDFKTRFQYSEQDNDKGYALSLDRPKYVVDVKLLVTPIQKLGINIDYQLRGKRAYYSPFIPDMDPKIPSWTNIKLNDVNQLNIGASYQITDYLGAFVQANNLLNKQWDDFYGMGAQKLNVLGGINIVF